MLPPKLLADSDRYGPNHPNRQRPSLSPARLESLPRSAFGLALSEAEPTRLQAVLGEGRIGREPQVNRKIGRADPVLAQVEPARDRVLSVAVDRSEGGRPRERDQPLRRARAVHELLGAPGVPGLVGRGRNSSSRPL